jgi:hypothetical protein
MIITAACSITSAAYANLGTTYKWSARHFGTRGIVVGDTANFTWNGYLITEGYNPRGICDIIMIAHLDGSDLSRAEVTQILSQQIPPGYVWHAYNGNPVCPTWECTFNGLNWYAMYYTNPGTISGYPVYRKCLRIGTQSALASRGYFNGSAPARVAKKTLPVRRRPKPRPELSLSEI